MITHRRTRAVHVRARSRRRLHRPVRPLFRSKRLRTRPHGDRPRAGVDGGRCSKVAHFSESTSTISRRQGTAFSGGLEHVLGHGRAVTRPRPPGARVDDPIEETGNPGCGGVHESEVANSAMRRGGHEPAAAVHGRCRYRRDPEASCATCAASSASWTSERTCTSCRERGGATNDRRESDRPG